MGLTVAGFGSWFDRFRVMHLRRLRARPLRLVSSILGMAAGVALAVASVGLQVSILTTARTTTELIGDAWVVSAPSGVGAAVVGDLRSAPGVTAVRGVVELPALIDGTYGWVIAQEPGAPERRAAALGAVTAPAFGGFDPSAALRPLTVTVASGATFSVTPSGAAPAQLRDLFGGRFLATDLATALSWYGLEDPPTVLVEGLDRAAIRRIVAGRASVSNGDDRVEQVLISLESVTSALGMISVISLVVGGFLVFNTMNMAALERRHELAAVRALGSSRRSLLSLVMAEAGLLGLVSAALGAVLGIALVSAMVSTIPDAFTRSMGTPLRAATPWWLVVVAILAGLVVTIIAAISPARRSMRIDPIEALRRDADLSGDVQVRTRWSWIAVGFALLVSGRLLSRPGVTYTIPTVLVLVGVVVFANGIVPQLTRIAATVCQQFGSAGRLGALAMTRAPRRVWATLMGIVMSVAMLVTLAGVVTNLRDTLGSDLRTGLRSEFWIGTSTGETVPFGGLPQEWEQQFAAIPGVAQVPGSQWQFVQDDDAQILLGAIHGDSSFTFFALGPAEARAALRRSEGAFIIKATARQRGLGVGDRIALQGATPPLELPILAVVDGAGVAGGGMVLISDDLYAKHFGVTTKSSYEVILEPDADRAAVRAALEGIVANAPLRARVMTGEEYVAAAIKSGDSLISVLAITFLVIVACAAIAMLNTMTSTVLDRQREFAVLRAVGASSRQIQRSLRAEALSIGIVGGLLALAIGLERHHQTVRTLSRDFVLHMEYEFVPATIVIALLTSIAIALFGSALPARRATRFDLLRSLADE